MDVCNLWPDSDALERFLTIRAHHVKGLMQEAASILGDLSQDEPTGAFEGVVKVLESSSRMVDNVFSAAAALDAKQDTASSWKATWMRVVVEARRLEAQVFVPKGTSDWTRAWNTVRTQ
eukprot:14332970-Alexandrium_andersonii.AAC.1